MDEIDTFDVMVGAVGDEALNALVLRGMDIVVPLEMDLDDDPLQDDEVILRSVDGRYERILLSDDEDVARDVSNQLFHYRFRLVPMGVYTILLRVAGETHEIVHDLIVRRDGAYIGSKQLPRERTGPSLAPSPSAEPEADPDDDILELKQGDRPYMDQDQD